MGIRGLKAYAITAMNSTVVNGFSPEQIVAAVCGTITWAVGDESQSLCPPAIVDLSMVIPEDRANFPIDHILGPYVMDPSDVAVLMNASQDELPVASGGRRLTTG